MPSRCWLENHLLEALAGALKGLNAGQLLAEGAAAIQAAALPHLQVQDDAAEPPVLVPDDAAAPAFIPQLGAAAVGAGKGPVIAGGNGDGAGVPFDLANLVAGQA